MGRAWEAQAARGTYPTVHLQSGPTAVLAAKAGMVSTLAHFQLCCRPCVNKTQLVLDCTVCPVVAASTPYSNNDYYRWLLTGCSCDGLLQLMDCATVDSPAGWCLLMWTSAFMHLQIHMVMVNHLWCCSTYNISATQHDHPLLGASAPAPTC